MRGQRLPDDVEQFLLLEAIRMIEILVGPLGLIGYQDACTVIRRERLVLPRQRSRRGESYGDGSIIPSVDPGYDVWRGNIETPERLQLTGTDFEKRVAVLPGGQVECGITADDIARILGSLGPKCDAESDIALRLTQR